MTVTTSPETTPLKCVSINLTEDPDVRWGLLVALPIEEIRRDAGTVYVRTVADEGPSVLVDHEKQAVVIEAGELKLALEAVDRYYARYDDTMQLAPVLDVWLRISGHAPANAFFYVTAAARRLDTARRLLGATESAIRRAEKIVEQNEPGQMLQIAVAEAVGNVELGVVALRRAADMAAQLQTEFGLQVSLNAESMATLAKLKDFRDAYEHIDERALRQVRRKPHPDAHSAFDHGPLFVQRQLEYAGNAVPLDALAQLAADVRAVLKQAAGDSLEPPSTAPGRLT